MTHDPYTPPETRTFECLDCGRRTDAQHQPVTCSVCGGDLRDISVPSEQ
ncbi:rubrerythrin-like domain-containing protein [Salinigranum salinum]|nr:rubrerythrin-like domain-containing protein [Salinigranum salinum]